MCQSTVYPINYHMFSNFIFVVLLNVIVCAHFVLIPNEFSSTVVNVVSLSRFHHAFWHSDVTNGMH